MHRRCGTRVLVVRNITRRRIRGVSCHTTTLGEEMARREGGPIPRCIYYRLTRSSFHCSTLQRSPLRGRVPRFEKLPRNRVDSGWLSEIRRRRQASCSRRCSIRCQRPSVEYHLQTTVVPRHHEYGKKKKFWLRASLHLFCLFSSNQFWPLRPESIGKDMIARIKSTVGTDCVLRCNRQPHWGPSGAKSCLWHGLWHGPRSS